MNKYLNFFILLLSIFFGFLNCNTSKVDAIVVPFGGNYSKEPVLVQITEISVNHEVSDDLRISWKFDPEHEFIFLDTKHIFIMFEMITMENGSFGIINAATFDLFGIGIRPQDIIRPIVIAYPQKPHYLRGIITKYNDEWTEKEQWIFNIDISNINVVISEEELKPYILTRFVGQQKPEIITLEDGQKFKGNAYYLISSYRKHDFLKSSYAIFLIDNDSEVIIINLPGGLYLEEMHIREILINGNNYDGFTLLVTPESTNIFKVEEMYINKY